MDRDTLVVQGVCHLREKLAAHVHEHLVRLHHVDPLHAAVLEQFLGNAAVAAADDEDVFGLGCKNRGIWVMHS